MDQIPAIARVFSYLSLLTIGGGMAAFPEMKVLVVSVHRWLTDAQLIHIYSVGQLSPGPNMMMVATIGERVAGIPGALVAALAFFVPTGFLTFVVGRVWKRLAAWPWRASIQRGLAPVAIGLAVARPDHVRQKRRDGLDYPARRAGRFLRCRCARASIRRCSSWAGRSVGAIALR